MPPKCFLLPAPWAYFDPQIEKYGIGRRVLSPDSRTKVPSGIPLFLATPAGGNITLSGHRMAAHPLSRSFHIGDTDYIIYCLSIGIREHDAIFTVYSDRNTVGTVEITSPVLRNPSADLETSHNNHAFHVDRFNLSILDIIRLGTDEKYIAHQVYWDRLTAAWTADQDEHSDPPMALIVRHAEIVKKQIDRISERPRSILRRTRKLTPLSRVDQVDISSIRWLSRQPGVTIAERAGSRQEIMAVQREESFDTLENRVLRDYAARAARVAHHYCDRYTGLAQSFRWALVNRYAQATRRHNRDMRQKDVPRASYPVIPNYVLQHDQNYRHLWRAYLEIIRQEDEEDEAWRWQYRLWCDFVRLTLQISLRSDTDRNQLIAESPVRISSEQNRGSWAIIDSLSGIWLADIEKVGEVVVSMIWSPDSEDTNLHPLQGLACTTILIVEPLESNSTFYIPIWAMHDFGHDPQPLQKQVESASRAIRHLKDNVLLIEDKKIHLAGVVISSDLTGQARTSEKPLVKAGDVIGYRLRTDRETLSADALVRLRQIVEMQIQQLLRGNLG